MTFSFRKRIKKQFQQLTDPHIQLVYNMALRYCGNSFDTKDILQEAMYIAFKNYHQLTDETKCKAWLLTILRRVYLKEIRQNKTRPMVVEDISCLPLMEHQIASDHSLKFEKEAAFSLHKDRNYTLDFEDYRITIWKSKQQVYALVT